jgi:hypothetical protein
MTPPNAASRVSVAATAVVPPMTLMSRLRALAKTSLPRVIVDLVFAVTTHRRRHGAFPRVLKPRTFNDWILRRKVFDRRPLLCTFVDKLAVRDYVAKQVGADILPAIYVVTSDPTAIRFENLPTRFVVKATHGSGWVRVVLDKSSLDVEELRQTCAKWLSSNYYDCLREGQYRCVSPRIMIEEFLDDGSGNSPTDYKFFIFNGQVKLIQIDIARFTGHRRALYHTDWRDSGVKLSFDGFAEPLAKPNNLERMIKTAQILGGSVDFVRVDLYDIGGKIYFGEMTPTPGGGMSRFEPEKMNEWLGSLWTAAAGAGLRARSAPAGSGRRV